MGGLSIDRPDVSSYLMHNFAGNQQMGRVSSQLRHDYKPGRPLSDRKIPRLRLLLAPVILLLGTVLLVSLNDAGGTLQSPKAAPSLKLSDGIQTLEVVLPRKASDEQPGIQPDMEDLGPVEHEYAHEPAGAKEETGPAEEPDASALPEGETLALRIKSGDSLDRLFRRQGLSLADLAAMLKSKEARNALAVIKPGDEIQVVHSGQKVLALTRELSEELTIRVLRDGDAFSVDFLADPVERRVAHARGRIKTSLFEAGSDAGMSDTLIMNLAGVFAWDVDFALEIREGDSFSLVYEEVWQDERRLRDGDVLAAEFINQGRVYRAVRYRDPNGKVDYYTPEGLSVRKAFLRAPLDFARVSSNFNPNRLHPILKTKRPHKGVDYAAPKGTAVKAAGDGRVIFRGRNGGYGNCVIIEHGGNITTLYAHLSKFAGSARKGSRVSQGQTIGYVGATGLATAPHLHYEYRLNGVHRNPRTVPLPEADPVPAEHRDDFLQAAQPLLAQLDAITPTRLARAD